MRLILAVVVGALYGTGLYMMVRRSFVKMIIGIGLLTQAANLLIFTMGRLIRSAPPLVPLNAESAPSGSADPLPHAIILTAIVIGFGVQAFSLVLIKRVYEATGTDDIDEMTTTDRLE